MLAMSPSLNVAGRGPLYRTTRSFLKSVMINLFSSVPFFISMDPCLTTPDSLNRQPGRVECIKKYEGVTDLVFSRALFACRNVPTVRIRVPQKSSLKTTIRFRIIRLMRLKKELEPIRGGRLTLKFKVLQQKQRRTSKTSEDRVKHLDFWQVYF